MDYKNMTKEELIKQCQNKDDDNKTLSKYNEYIEKSIENLFEKGNK